MRQRELGGDAEVFENPDSISRRTDAPLSSSASIAFFSESNFAAGMASAYFDHPVGLAIAC
jgi:hypothetical protein